LKKINDSVSISGNFKGKKASGAEPVRLISKIYNFLYTSELVHFLLHETHKQLKVHGIILPGSQFDLMLKSYWQNDDNWRQSKILLKEIIDHSKEKDIQLIVYLFPEMDLLEHQNLFTKSRESIKSFFDGFPDVYYIDGNEQFKNEISKDYVLSKYDGHPNEKAHKKIAEKVFELIKETNKAYSKNDK
jgi:hypothetical protein